ncbi:Ceramide synthase 2 [Acipenser ruthenus]|uniref:Ceramide synthase 2 n=1 Tax=Acipenser ruthenus TaxID=7906 RepID=A0A444V556_ACIRT|nr:Ceramide synthase 2 [Acipenser ruthenus]
MHEASSRSERDESCDLDNMSSLRCPAGLLKRHSYNDRQKETACLQLSLIEMMSSHVHSPSRGVHDEDCMGILRVLLEEMDLVSQLISLFGDQDKLFSHLAVKCVSSLVIFQITITDTLNEVWQKMCCQAFRERPDSSAMNGCLWSLTAVVKGVFKGTFQCKTEILENLFTSFDPAFNALYATMFSLSPRGMNQEPSTYTKEGDNVTTNLVSFIDLLEVFVAARTKLRICFPVQRLLFQQAVLALRMVASPVQYLVKKKLLALFKRCLLQKAGEDFFKGEVDSSLKHDGNLKSDMLALANSVLQSVHAGWLQDIPVSPKPSFFGGTEVLGNSNVEGGPDLVMLRAASLILIKSLEYKVQNSTTEEGVADLLSYLCLLKLFLKKHLKSASVSQHLLHPCTWVSVIFMEQDDDMIEAAKALLILHLHFRRLSGIISDGVDSTGSLTQLTHENGCNPHCMFFLFLSSVAFDHTVLLDFLISTETCFLEYFVKYLKLVREDWEHFCTACHYCDSVSSETGEQNAACGENACGSKTISQDDQACRQLVFPVAENVLESESPESQTKCNVKYSDGPLVDYGSSDESGSDLVEPVCLATGKQCSEGLQDDSFKIGNSVCQSGDKDQTLSKHCQVTGDQGILMHSSLRDNMLMLQTISDYFWWDRLWFPGNLTWTDFEDRDGLVFAKVSHLFITVPYAVAFMVIRYVFERFIATHIGKKIFGLRETVRLKASENIVLEKYFITRLRNPSQSDLEGLAKKCNWTVRKVERWFRRRRNQERPSVLKKFREACWRFVFYLSAFIGGFAVLYDDFKEQIIHHVATLNLLAFSWCCNYIRVGTLVMLIHDASDVLLESAKMFNYAGFTMICNSLFVLFTIVFIITRLVIFPFWIIHCTWFYPVLFFPPFFGYYFFNAMLIVLQMLHIFWTYLILRMVKKFIFGNVSSLIVSYLVK